MENVKIKRGGHFYGIGTLLLCYYYLLIFKNDFRLIASFTPRKRVGNGSIRSEKGGKLSSTTQ